MIDFGVAYAGGQAMQKPGGLASFLPMIIIIGIVYFLMILPQQKRQRKHNQMLSSLKAGDEVLLANGLFGKVNNIAENGIFYIEISSSVIVKVLKSGISDLVTISNTTDK